MMCSGLMHAPGFICKLHPVGTEKLPVPCMTLWPVYGSVLYVDISEHER